MASKAKIAKTKTSASGTTRRATKASAAKSAPDEDTAVSKDAGETVVLTPRPTAAPVVAVPSAPVARVAGTGGGTSGGAAAAPADGVLKLKELVDASVARSGSKKRDVKPAVEAAMAVLSEALAAGRDVRLPGFGKLRVVKEGGPDGGPKVLTLKLRRPDGD